MQSEYLSLHNSSMCKHFDQQLHCFSMDLVWGVLAYYRHTRQLSPPL